MNTRAIFVRALVAAACWLSLALTASAAGPQITFTSDGVTIDGVAPGRKIAWIAIIRERGDGGASVRSSVGMEPARPNGSVTVVAANADESYALWAAVEVETGAAVRRATPRYSVSSRPIEVTAVSQAPSILIKSPCAEVLWVRPNGGAWTIAAYDGGAYDADGRIDGTITIALQSMRRIQGNPHPPSELNAGDVILILDARQMRSAIAEVTQ